MERRSFIKTGITATLATSIGTKGVAINKNPTYAHPNIVVIMTDQQTAKAMSCAGNKELNTPAMDEIASHGTRFENAYCPQPLCGPSRSSMMTGKMPHEVRCTINQKEQKDFLPKDLLFLGKHFKNNGYDTGYIGKWHTPIPVSETNQHGFDYMVNTAERDWQDASIPADCNTFLKRKRNKPFLMVASFVNPHDICEWARDQQLRMEPISSPPNVRECPDLPSNHEIPKGEPNIIRQQQLKSWKTYPSVDYNTEHWRQYRWAYNRLIEHVDRYIGYVTTALKKNNVWDNSIILFLSDHGDGYAHHKWNQKQVLYQEVINVPFIISSPNQFYSKVNKESLVNTGLDLIPTLCDFAKISTPQSLKGVSQKMCAETAKGKARDFVVIETEFANGKESYGITGRTIICDNKKYIIYSEGEKREQLFDLQKNPLETLDLIYETQYIDVKNYLKSLLQKWCKENNDTFYKYI